MSVFYSANIFRQNKIDINIAACLKLTKQIQHWIAPVRYALVNKLNVIKIYLITPPKKSIKGEIKE